MKTITFHSLVLFFAVVLQTFSQAPSVTSIERQDPTNATTSTSEVTFRVIFNTNVSNVDTSDFSLNSTVGGTINSVNSINAQTYDVNVNSLTGAGTVSLQIKGVDGVSGSNDISSLGATNSESVTIAQTNSDDYLNQVTIGQTFTATTSNFLTAITIFPKSGQHNFNGTATLTLYDGDKANHSPSVLLTETVTITSSTDSGGQKLTLSAPISVTQNNMYSFELSNFSGIGPQALTSSTSGNYGSGQVFFTGFNSSSHGNFDLKFNVFEGTVNAGVALSTTAPSTNENYTKTDSGVLLSSITRLTPTDATTNADEVTFRVTFADEVIRVDTSDFELSGTAAADGTIESITTTDDKNFDIKITGITNSSGTLNLNVKGVDGTGSNNILKRASVADANATADLQGTNSNTFGQSFNAENSGYLYAITLKKGFGHSYNGQATLTLHQGEGYTSTILATQTIDITSNVGEETYLFDNPALISVLSQYTFRVVISSSGTTAFSAQTGDNYSGGDLYQAVIYPATADLFFKLFVSTNTTEGLRSMVPSIDESYTIVNPPTINSSSAANITTTSVELQGDVSGLNITERGFVYSSTDIDPEIGNANVSKVVEGTGEGSFDETISSLTENTTYYYKTYAINSDGTGYSTVKQFTTLETPKVISITRKSPTDETTNNTPLTFNVLFNKAVTNVDVTDFSLNSTVGGNITNVTEVSSTSYDVEVSGVSGTGTLALQIKGIDGASSSNNISEASYVGTETIVQSSANDYLNQSELGQTFTATTSGFLTDIAITKEAGQHNFEGTATLNIILGNILSSPPNIHTETVFITSDSGEQKFTLTSPVQLTLGQEYSFSFNNFSGTGNHAFSSSISGDYNDGRVYFSGTDSSSHTAFDLVFKIFEGTTTTAGDLIADMAPTTNESYNFFDATLSANTIDTKEFGIYYSSAKDAIIIIQNVNAIQVERLLVYNTQGQLVKNATNIHTEFSVNELGNGIYFIKLYTETGLFQYKFVK